MLFSFQGTYLVSLKGSITAPQISSWIGLLLYRDICIYFLRVYVGVLFKGTFFTQVKVFDYCSSTLLHVNLVSYIGIYKHI